jgi:hypothetical protein
MANEDEEEETEPAEISPTSSANPSRNSIHISGDVHTGSQEPGSIATGVKIEWIHANEVHIYSHVATRWATWAVVIFAVLTVFAVVLTNLATIAVPDFLRPILPIAEIALLLGTIISIGFAVKQAMKAPIILDTPTDRRRRHRLLEKVRAIWITGVLDRSLYSELLIRLDIEERPEAVNRPWDIVLRENDRHRQLASGTKVIEVFDELGGELLILGAPGAGKTTTLLELARDLIVRTEQEDSNPTPVIFNLSSWASRWEFLVDWLVDELYSEYDVPRKIGKAWIESGSVLPLLDGLDEVRSEYRAVCVKAINKHRREHGLEMIVVCSRLIDYELLSIRLKMQGAILLLPLTPTQIDDALLKVGTKLETLRTLLHTDSDLQELANTPLMLSIMILAYHGVPSDFQSAGTMIGDLRRHLFGLYVIQMLQRRTAWYSYTQEQSIRWLIWLAQQMTREAQSIFQIERIQQSFLQTQSQRQQYARGKQLMGVLAGGLIGWLIGWLIGGPIFGFTIAVLLVTISLQYDVNVDIKTLYDKDLTQSIRIFVASWLAVWLIVGLIYVLSGQLVNKLVGGLDMIFIGLVVGMIAGLLNGGGGVIQHFILRILLYRTGSVPWKYATFLNYCVDHIILRKVGSSYIFIHRLLLEYFASLDENDLRQLLKGIYDSHNKYQAKGRTRS